MTKSGYRVMDIGEYGQPGSNGLTLDKQGRLTINQHRNHRPAREVARALIQNLSSSVAC